MNKALETKASIDHSLKPELPSWLQEADIDAIGGAQSMIFMGDMLPSIFDAFDSVKPKHGPISVLDVGPGTGHGANFLGQVTSAGFLGHQSVVRTIDIEATYQNYIGSKHPYVEKALVGDIYLHEDSYDVVVCSHVIEHVPDPARFIRRLQSLARYKVVLCAPWQEPSDSLSPGHVNSFDEDFLAQLEVESFSLKNSVGWGYFLRPRYSVMILTLPGHAGEDGL